MTNERRGANIRPAKREGENDVKYLRLLVPAFLLMAAMVALGQPAAAHERRLVAVIHGAGLSTMDAMGNLRGPTSFTIDARLYSDGSATGWIYCADLKGSINPADGSGVEGVVAGPVSRWSRVNGKIALTATLTLAGTPLVLSSTVTIQKFGGAGKGHWTMSLPAFETPGGPPTCSEAITSGRLVIDYSNREDED